MHREPDRVTGSYRDHLLRRKINIESLNTSPSEVEGIHRFTIVINEVEEVVEKLARQIEKQVEVLASL